MGGGPDKSLGEDKKEVLLVLLPIPYPTAYLDPIKKRFPRLEVEYINVAHTEGLETEAAIPAGSYLITVPQHAHIVSSLSSLHISYPFIYPSSYTLLSISYLDYGTTTSLI